MDKERGILFPAYEAWGLAITEFSPNPGLSYALVVPYVHMVKFKAKKINLHILYMQREKEGKVWEDVHLTGRSSHSKLSSLQNAPHNKVATGGW